MIPVLRTSRLRLRGPSFADFEPVAAFLASERSRFVGGPRLRRQAWNAFAALVGHWELKGYGMWCVDEGETGSLVGMVGLFDPEGWLAPEIGWWITDPAHEGKGYAREAALAARRYAYGIAGWPAAYSVIDPDNLRSIRLAESLGATVDRTVGADEDGGPALIYRHPPPEALQ
jgi:RimJ/RimL family protein N-acetyltransferase